MIKLTVPNEVVVLAKIGMNRTGRFIIDHRKEIIEAIVSGACCFVFAGYIHKAYKESAGSYAEDIAKGIVQVVDNHTGNLLEVHKPTVPLLWKLDTGEQRQIYAIFVD